jgi:hypothetical protein
MYENSIIKPTKNSLKGEGEKEGLRKSNIDK